MKILKEAGFRCFILLVMLSLAFVAYDMSMPVLSSEKEVLVIDVVECIVQPFSSAFDDTGENISEQPTQGYNFILNILLPILVYIVSIAGFFYLLLEDFKLLKTFAHTNRLAKTIWCLWIIILICLMLIPIFFGLQLLMKGFVLAVIATAIFLILLGILYSLSSRTKKLKS